MKGSSAVWRKISRAVFEDQASKCPNVERVLYAEANADQQKYAASINSLVAQNVDVIVTFTDFGDATLPIARWLVATSPLESMTNPDARAVGVHTATMLLRQ